MDPSKYIGFNKPHLTGRELDYIYEAFTRGKLSGNGFFTQKSQSFFEQKYSFKKCLLTTSCTDALEMAAILIGIEPGDEVIIPSYTFVSTANAFVLRGAKIVFLDSRSDHPGMNEDQLESLITNKTKAIVPVHYAGVACDMDKIVEVAAKHKLYIVEDAAQAIDSYYHGKPLGSIGHLSAFSFHETKNIISGEGGMLVVNDPQFIKRAEIIWEKGTNRSAFFKGEVDKYGWVDVGSSFLPSEIIAAFLFAQLENLDSIQTRRKEIWETYYAGLQELEEKKFINLPAVPGYASNNAHMFYLVCRNGDERDQLIARLASHGVNSVFHYLSLHRSPFYKGKNQNASLPNSDHFESCLLRLPFFNDITDQQQEIVIQSIFSFYNDRKKL